jgi:hypothetical protein
MAPAALIKIPLHVAEAFQHAVSQVFEPAEPAASSEGLRIESPRYGRLESLRYASSWPSSKCLHKL